MKKPRPGPVIRMVISHFHGKPWKIWFQTKKGSFRIQSEAEPRISTDGPQKTQMSLTFELAQLSTRYRLWHKCDICHVPVPENEPKPKCSEGLSVSGIAKRMNQRWASMHRTLANGKTAVRRQRRRPQIWRVRNGAVTTCIRLDQQLLRIGSRDRRKGLGLGLALGPGLVGGENRESSDFGRADRFQEKRVQMQQTQGLAVNHESWLPPQHPEN